MRKLILMLGLVLGGCVDDGRGPRAVYVMNDWQPTYLGTEHPALPPITPYPADPEGKR